MTFTWDFGGGGTILPIIQRLRVGCSTLLWAVVPKKKYYKVMNLQDFRKIIGYY